MAMNVDALALVRPRHAAAVKKIAALAGLTGASPACDLWVKLPDVVITQLPNEAARRRAVVTLRRLLEHEIAVHDDVVAAKGHVFYDDLVAAMRLAEAGADGSDVADDEDLDDDDDEDWTADDEDLDDETLREEPEDRADREEREERRRKDREDRWISAYDETFRELEDYADVFIVEGDTQGRAAFRMMLGSLRKNFAGLVDDDLESDSDDGEEP